MTNPPQPPPTPMPPLPSWPGPGPVGPSAVGPYPPSPQPRPQPEPQPVPPPVSIDDDAFDDTCPPVGDPGPLNRGDATRGPRDAGVATHPTPLDVVERIDRYQRQRGRRTLTLRQWRRVSHKQGRAMARGAA